MLNYQRVNDFNWLIGGVPLKYVKYWMTKNIGGVPPLIK
jgi:hypothetical protein